MAVCRGLVNGVDGAFSLSYWAPLVVLYSEQPTTMCDFCLGYLPCPMRRNSCSRSLRAACLSQRHDGVRRCSTDYAAGSRPAPSTGPDPGTTVTNQTLLAVAPFLILTG